MQTRRRTGTACLAAAAVIAAAWVGATLPGDGTASAQLGQQQQQHQQQQQQRALMDMAQASPEMMRMMRRAHAGEDSAWEVNSEGIFILRGKQLLRYDLETLELTAEAELPEEISPVLGIEREDEAADQAQPPRQQRRQQLQERMHRMQQMMTQAQASLRTDLKIVEDDIYVARGNQLLRFNADLELQEGIELPAVHEDVDVDVDEENNG